MFRDCVASCSSTTRAKTQRRFSLSESRGTGTRGARSINHGRARPRAHSAGAMRECTPTALDKATVRNCEYGGRASRKRRRFRREGGRNSSGPTRRFRKRCVRARGLRRRISRTSNAAILIPATRAGRTHVRSQLPELFRPRAKYINVFTVTRERGDAGVLREIVIAAGTLLVYITPGGIFNDVNRAPHGC